MWRTLLAGSIALWAACGHNIGDPCSVNTDCNPIDSRWVCDVSAPGGYCTMENCDVSVVGGSPVPTCPGGSVCVRFFQPIESRPCDPLGSDCLPSERCVCDASDPSQPGRCLPSTDGAPTGHCAPESSERRTCERLCNSSADCRPGYECRQTGTHGAEPVPTKTIEVSTLDGGTVALAVGDAAKFCVQKGR